MSQTSTVRNSKIELEKVQKCSISSQIDSQISYDVLKGLLADKRSYATRQSYAKSLKYFFQSAYHQDANEKVITRFLQLDKFDAIAIVLKYKSDLINKGLSESTINCRLAALRSLVSFAAKIGKCLWLLDDIKSESVIRYRDTTGVSSDHVRTMFTSCDRLTVKGKRDYAILRLLWSNALRRNELVSLNFGDFDYQHKSMQILGKGHGSQKTLISLDVDTVESIQDWLCHNDIKDYTKSSRDQPLFCALDRCHIGHRLTGTSIYQIVSLAARRSGVKKNMSPHRIRHSAITAALEATDGDVRKVQKLSRHKKLDTLMIYDDNRTNAQGEVTDILGEML